MQSPLLHAARTNPQTVRIKKEYFHAISSFVGKQEKVAGAWVLLQLTNDQRIQAIKPEAHICRAGSNINARSRAQSEHRATPPSRQPRDARRQSHRNRDQAIHEDRVAVLLQEGIGKKTAPVPSRRSRQEQTRQSQRSPSIWESLA